MAERGDPAFYDAGRAVQRTLQALGRPAPADEVMRASGLNRAQAYMGLVWLHDGGLVRIHIGAHRGRKLNEWELM